jgi:hypothetical protein
MRAWPQTDVSASLPAGLGLKKEGRIGLERDSMRRNQRRHRERSVAIQGPPPQPYDPLDRRIAIARRKTGVFRRPMAPRDGESFKAEHAPSSCLLVSSGALALGRYPFGGSLFSAALRMNAELAP